MPIKVTLLYPGEPTYLDQYGPVCFRRGRTSWLFRFGLLVIAGWRS